MALFERIYADQLRYTQPRNSLVAHLMLPINSKNFTDEQGSDGFRRIKSVFNSMISAIRVLFICYL